MRILWIEDFDKNIEDQMSLVENIFKDLVGKEDFKDFPRKIKINIKENLPKYFKKHKLIHDVEVCYNWTEYDKDFVGRLFEFDLFIIDINLTAKGMSDSEKLKKYKESFDKFAGFYIYNDLITRGIDFKNISLMTANKENIEGICYQYAMPVPGNLFDKSDSGYSAFRQWLQTKADNRYIQLRRGILDACDYLKENPKEILLNDHIKKEEEKLPKEYGTEYINLLRNFFLNKFNIEESKRKEIFNTFLMLLSAEWERFPIKTDDYKNIEPNVNKVFQRTCIWIMKNLRNNMAHFSFDKNLSEKDIAFFCIIAFRSFFRLDQNKYPAEEIFLSPIHISKNFDKIIDINKVKKDELYDLCIKKKVKNKENNQFLDFSENDRYIIMASNFLALKGRNDPKTVTKEDKIEHSKKLLCRAYLSELEPFLSDESNKDSIIYKLGQMAFELSEEKDGE